MFLSIFLLIIMINQFSFIWERIWEKEPIGNFSRHKYDANVVHVFTNLIAEKPFQLLQTILKYS